jgi:hypothetical protein
VAADDVSVPGDHERVEDSVLLDALDQLAELRVIEADRPIDQIVLG